MQASTLFQAFQNVSGSSFVGFDSLTTVTLTGGKKNPQQGRITKRMTGASVMVFQNKNSNGYENMVNRRLIAEGKDPESFTLGERAWGTRVENMPIVEHTKDGVTKHYMEVIFLKPGHVEYFIDGTTPIAKSEIIGLKESGEGEQGGLENKVVIRAFAAENITEIRVDGTKFN